MEPIFLTLDEVMEIHDHQMELHGGNTSIRDFDLLESAVAQPYSGFGDDYFHKDLYEMAAAYLYHITQNHPFVDGNKRTGAQAADVLPLRLQNTSPKAKLRRLIFRKRHFKPPPRI